MRLLVKIHNVTGLKYLCKTERDDWKSYPGSGKYWLNHIKEHGRDIRTLMLFQTDDRDLFREIAHETSLEFDIVNSDEWANLIPETGEGWSVGMKRGPMSSEHKAKLSAVDHRGRGKGRKLSEAHKLAVSKGKKGRPLGPPSAEHRRKLSLALKGNTNGRYGRAGAKANH